MKMNNPLKDFQLLQGEPVKWLIKEILNNLEPEQRREICL